MARVFVTGASGFLGRQILGPLSRAGHSVTALTRGSLKADAAVRVIEGDLLEPATYADGLQGCDLVLHLAAATGKALPAEHFRVNLEGTRWLLDACRAAAVTRFVLISSIAVKFRDIARYPYAVSKARAEELVRSSGLDFTVVRPTIIAGRGSAVLQGLSRLAGLPVVPVFGDGQARVQPILVTDLATLIVDVIDTPVAHRATLEFGGPDVVTIQQLLEDIHRVVRRRSGKVMHIPLGPLLPLLSVLERVAYQALPVTVGQLSTFRFDGTAESNPIIEKRSGSLTRLPDMLRLTFQP